MIHFFKRKKIILECFTNREELITDAPIDYAFKYTPEWWKSLPKPCVKPKEMFANNNMRHCPGFVELYKHSIAIPLWSDLKVNIGGNNTEPYAYAWQYADRRSKVEVHPTAQRGAYLPEKEYQHLKLITPWALRTNRNIKWAWFGATWNLGDPKNVLIPPGIDEYYNQHSATINMFVPRTHTDTEFILPFRSPLVFITPMSEHKVQVKHIVLSNEEFERMQTSGNYTPKFFNSYYNIRKIRNK